jgi:hypothetical protein
MSSSFYYSYYNNNDPAEYFNVDISAWNVESVTKFDYMFTTSSMNQILCWYLDFTKPITVASMFGTGGTYLIDPSAAKCACEVNEFYDGAECKPCSSGTISFGKTESCMNCTNFLCSPSPSPTLSAIPSVTPVPTTTPEPSVLPTPTPTIDPTMVQVTKISSSYVSTPAVKTEILHAEEIMLNGVEISSTSRRLTAGSEVLSTLVEEVQRKQETMMAHIEEQRAMIAALQTANIALRISNDALHAKVDAHQTSISELKVGV